MKNLSDIVVLAKKKVNNIIVVAAAHDMQVLQAIKKAVTEQIIVPILIGNEKFIRKIASDINFDICNIEIINELDSSLSAIKAVAYINERKGNILMKGILPTATLLKAVLDKNIGLLKSNPLSHIALCESKNYHKVFAISDGAMNIAPTLLEKENILNNAVNVLTKLGIHNPKVAIIAPIETVNEKIESTIHAAQLTNRYKQKQITGCIVEGPMALDIAISLSAAEHKGIYSDVAGDADILLVSNLDSGNILYKSLVFLGGALTAAIVTGAKVPIVLTSRADTEHNKFMSIALAATMA